MYIVQCILHNVQLYCIMYNVYCISLCIRFCIPERYAEKTYMYIIYTVILYVSRYIYTICNIIIL